MEGQQPVRAAREDVVNQQGKHIESLTQAVINLRDRQSQAEVTAQHTAEVAWGTKIYVEQQKAEDASRQAEALAMYGGELIPYIEDINKLPVRYDDKNFWYLSLPLAHTGLFFKRMARLVSSYFITSADIDSTREVLREAHNERELLNIIRAQRAISQVERVVGSCIRKNRDNAVYRVGSNTSENEVVAYMLERHFSDTGFCSRAVITTDPYNIYLHLDIAY